MSDKTGAEKLKNLAFIDGQNLYMGTAKREKNPWKIDLKRFRVYLEQKYGVVKAYYFLGYVQETNEDLYEERSRLPDSCWYSANTTRRCSAKRRGMWIRISSSNR